MVHKLQAVFALKGALMMVCCTAFALKSAAAVMMMVYYGITGTPGLGGYSAMPSIRQERHQQMAFPW